MLEEATGNVRKSDENEGIIDIEVINKVEGQHDTDVGAKIVDDDPS